MRPKAGRSKRTPACWLSGGYYDLLVLRRKVPGYQRDGKMQNRWKDYIGGHFAQQKNL